MPISCHFRDCKALLVTSLTHVSGAIASVQTFIFTLTLTQDYLRLGVLSLNLHIERASAQIIAKLWFTLFSVAVNSVL